MGKTTHAFYEQSPNSISALLPPLPALQHALVASSTAVAELQNYQAHISRLNDNGGSTTMRDRKREIEKKRGEERGSD